MIGRSTDPRCRDAIHGRVRFKALELPRDLCVVAAGRGRSVLNLGDQPLGWSVSGDVKVQLVFRLIGRSHVVLLAVVAVAGKAYVGHGA